MREILPGVLVWSRLSERHGYDFNGALVLHPDGNLCIDPVEPSEEDIRHYLSGNLCRCAAYPEIIEAVKLAARRRNQSNERK